MEISNSDPEKGPWKTILRKELKDPTGIGRKLIGRNNRRRGEPGKPGVMMEPFKVGKQVGRYVKFTCESYWGIITCALHSIVIP